MWKSFLIATSVMLVSLPSAYALELTNNDEIEYTIVVTDGEGDGVRNSYDLEAGTTLVFDCAAGCTVEIVDGMQQQFNGSEVVTIIDNEFVINE